MNILLPTSVFLMVLAYSSLSLVKERSVAYQELRVHEGFLNAQRLARGELEERIYKQNKPKNRALTEKKKSSDQSTKKAWKNPRDKFSPSEDAKLDITPLIREESSWAHYHLLYEVAAAHLRNLYGHASFFQNKEKLEYELLDALIEQAKNHPEENSFLDLELEKCKHNEIFFKLLIGTNLWDFKNHKGYPRLEDCFIIKAKTSADFKMLAFHFASTALLTTVFGKETAEAILTKEQEGKEAWRAAKDKLVHTEGDAATSAPLLKQADFIYLKEETLEDLIKHHSKGQFRFEDIKGLLNWKISSTSSRQVAKTDPSTGITVRLEPLEKSTKKN